MSYRAGKVMSGLWERWEGSESLLSREGLGRGRGMENGAQPA